MLKGGVMAGGSSGGSDASETAGSFLAGRVVAGCIRDWEWATNNVVSGGPELSGCSEDTWRTALSGCSEDAVGSASSDYTLADLESWDVDIQASLKMILAQLENSGCRWGSPNTWLYGEPLARMSEFSWSGRRWVSWSGCMEDKH